MKTRIIFCLALLALVSCVSDEGLVPVESDSSDFKIVNRYNYNTLIAQIGEEKLSRAVEQPNTEGALGRNKNGYFHVRFQLPMTTIIDFAVVTNRIDALHGFMKILDFSFDHQLEDGSYEISPPFELLNSPDYKAPSEGDLASGVSFFASSLGISLLTLQNSQWFTTDPLTETYRNQLKQYEINIQKTLDYLIESQEILKAYDATAPNRLLFNALSFYTLGTYLNRTDAISISRTFSELALSQIDAVDGYFIEKNGYDSSYNGVAIKLAMELISLLEFENSAKLESAILKATQWQIGRITKNGEILTEGNSRVFPGGESFIGTEKSVDYAKTIKALYYFSTITDNPQIKELGDKVLEFYN